MSRLWADAESAYRRRILASLPDQPRALLLDVGCDDGVWTEEVRAQVGARPSNVYGIEIVPQRAALARARGFDVRVADLEDRWPLDDGSVDVVHANQVIEHVKRLDHFVEEIARVLVPSGTAVVCTENLASWHNVGALVMGLQPFSLTNVSSRGYLGNPFALHLGQSIPVEASQHIHVVTLPALRDLFSLHGLVPERIWGAGYHPLSGKLARLGARFDPRHAHFIGLVARRPA
jgi:SAM-dependent methyltransferase